MVSPILRASLFLHDNMGLVSTLGNLGQSNNEMVALPFLNLYIFLSGHHWRYLERRRET